MYKQKVILRQPGTAMLRFMKLAVFAFRPSCLRLLSADPISIFEPVTCKHFNTLHFHSKANKKVIDIQCTSVLFFRVFANQNPGLPVLFQLATPLVPSANHCPRITAHYHPKPFRPLPLRAPNSLRIIDLQKSIKTKDFSILWNDRLTKNGGEGGTSFKPRYAPCSPLALLYSPSRRLAWHLSPTVVSY